MARDLTAAWEFLTGATRARQRLATARPIIWDKARLPTAEHTAILRTPPTGDRGRPPGAADTDVITIRVSLETLLKDGRRLASCVDLVAGPRHWRVRPYIVLGDATERPLWEGQSIDREDWTGFADAVDSAAYAVLEATVNLEFAAIERG
ncbi:MAG: hypothetical protein ABSC46_07640 [Candidatus Limnocylindrales bacterium]|jgi:hypothetical protein